MKYFSQLEGEQAIVRAGGVFKQVDLYTRGEDNVLFVKVGSGYMRLLDNHKTSHPKTFWDEMSVRHKVAAHGHLQLTQGII